jgi:hypothetical protein
MEQQMRKRLAPILPFFLSILFLAESTWLYLRHHIALYAVMGGLAILLVFVTSKRLHRKGERR